MPKQESVDELLANIDLEKFVSDYNIGIPWSVLKKKYIISSEKSFQAFLKSLESMDMIRQSAPRATKVEEVSHNSSSELSPIQRKVKTIRGKNMFTSTNNMRIQADDTFIEDILLGLDTSTKEKLDTVKENDNNENLEKLKDQIVFLWRAGIPSSYICEKYGITYNRFIMWRDRLELPQRNIFTNIPGRIRRLENEIMATQIMNKIDAYGIMYLSEIKKSFDLNEKELDSVISNNQKINIFRMCFRSEKRTTQETVRFFHAKAFESILYLDRKNLIVELIRLFNADAKLSSDLNLDSLRSVFNDLFRSERTSQEDELLATYWRQNQIPSKLFILNSEIYYKDEIVRLEQLLEIWKDVSLFTTKKKQEVNVPNTEAIGVDNDLDENIKEEILRILELAATTGVTINSVSAKLRNTFPNQIIEVKNYFLRLIEDQIVVRSIKGRMPYYLLSKYQKTKLITDISNNTFGRPLKHTEYIQEISSLNPGKLESSSNNQTTRLAALLMAKGIIVRAPKLEYELDFDFIIMPYDKEIYVKVDLQSFPTVDYILDFKQKIPPSSAAILVTRHEIDEKVNNILSYINQRRAKDENLQIWTGNTLNNLISEIVYEPALLQTHVRVKRGQYCALIGAVASNDYSNMGQAVSILGLNTMVTLPFYDIEEISPDSKMILELNSYLQLTSILQSISDLREFHAGINFNPSDVELGTHIIKCDLSPEWTGFRISDDDNSNDLPQDFCRKKVISCDCIMWNDQNKEELYVCRHIVAFMYKLWSKTQHVNRINMGVRNLRFFVFDTFILYRFFMLLILNGSIEMCKLMNEVLRVKLESDSEQMGLDQVLNNIEKQIQFTEHSTPDQKRTLSSKSKINSSYSNIKGYNFETIKSLRFLTNKNPQLKIVFQRLQPPHVVGCVDSINEMSKIFLSNRNVTLNELEHFVIEFMRYEGIPSEKSVALTHIAWENGVNNIQDCIIFVRSAVKP